MSQVYTYTKYVTTAICDFRHTYGSFILLAHETIRVSFVTTFSECAAAMLRS
jgi:hypothetical protein